MAAEEKVKQLVPGTLINGKYSVEKTLGIGGMGAVYCALHVEIGRRVAIKLLNPSLVQNDEMLARFRREAKAAAIIGHPGIVDVYDIGTAEDGSPFIVMEYLDGVTLSQQIKSKGRLPVHEAIGYACEVLDALQAAHKAGIVHRDLKPGNIFITERTRIVKVLDFGISKFHGMDEDLGLTKTGVSMGTPLYMSPEQIRDTRLAGSPSDLYAVGAILYRSLSGKPPFQAETYGQMIAKVLTETHVPLDELIPEVPAPIARVVDRLLAKVPELRPRDALETKTELMRAMAESMDGGTNAPVVNLVAEEPPSGRGEQTISAKQRAARAFGGGNDMPTGVQTPSPVATQHAGTSTSETADVRKIGASRGVWFGGALVGLLVVGTAIGIATRGPHRDVLVPATPTMPTAPTSPATDITLRLIAQPLVARWRVDGEQLNCNPCEVDRKKGGVATAEAEAPGYVTQSAPLRFDTNHDVNLRLERAPLNEQMPPPSHAPTAKRVPPTHGKNPLQPSPIEKAAPKKKDDFTIEKDIKF